MQIELIVLNEQKVGDGEYISACVWRQLCKADAIKYKIKLRLNEIEPPLIEFER